MTIIHSVFASTLNGGGEGLICIYPSVSPSTLNGGGGGAHLHLPQCVSFYLEWRWGRGSFAFTTVCLPLPRVEVGEGLICIYHSVSPTLSGGGGVAPLHLPQCVSLYLEWRWERGSFAFTTVCLPLP